MGESNITAKRLFWNGIKNVLMDLHIIKSQIYTSQNTNCWTEVTWITFGYCEVSKVPTKPSITFTVRQENQVDNNSYYKAQC